MSFEWLSPKNRNIIIIALILAMVGIYFFIFNKNFSYVVPGARNLITYSVSGGKVYYSVSGFGTRQEIKGVDSHSFKVMSDNYISDKDGVYFCSDEGCNILSKDIKNFSLIDFDMAKDSFFLYYKGDNAGKVSGKIKDFKEYGQEYLVDDAHVWIKIVNRRDCQGALSLLSGLNPQNLEWTIPDPKYILLSDRRHLFYLYREVACDSDYFDSWQTVSFSAPEDAKKVVQDSSGNFRYLLKDSQDAIFDQGKLRLGFVPEKIRQKVLASPDYVVTLDK